MQHQNVTPLQHPAQIDQDTPTRSAINHNMIRACQKNTYGQNINMPQDNLGAPHTMTPPCHPTSCNIPYNRNVTVPTMRSHQNQHSMKLNSSRTTFASKKAQMCHQLALFGQSAVPFGLPGIQLLRNRKLLRELVQLFHKGCLAGCTLPAKLSWDLGIGPKSKANSLFKKNNNLYDQL